MRTGEYNGWKNYQTWNVALFIGNDEGIYRMAAKKPRHGRRTYTGFLSRLQGMGYTHTDDGVNLADKRLDRRALTAMLQELQGE